MTGEFDHGRKINPEKSKLTPTEQAIQNIEEFIKPAEMESARFQAFADYVDHTYEKYWSNESTINGMGKLHLIEETIRQRQNGIRGYRAEYKAVRTLHKELQETIDHTTIDQTSRYKKGLPFVDIEHLKDIKNRAIDVKSQPTPTQTPSKK